MKANLKSVLKCFYIRLGWVLPVAAETLGGKSIGRSFVCVFARTGIRRTVRTDELLTAVLTHQVALIEANVCSIFRQARGIQISTKTVQCREKLHLQQR